MFGVGTWEVVVIAVIALIVLGPKRLPATLKTVGRTLGQFRRAVSQIKEEVGYDDVVDEVVRPLRDGMNELHSGMHAELTDRSSSDSERAKTRADDADEISLGVTTEYPEGGPDDYGALPEKGANDYGSAAYAQPDNRGESNR